MSKLVKSEEVSEYVGYWFREDGAIIERVGGTILPVYSSGVVRLEKADGTKDTPVAHRLIALAFVPKPEGSNFVRFKDGDNGNRAASNLEWVFGVRKIGVLSQEIISMKKLGMSTAEIAHQVQRTPQYVNRVLKDHKKRMVTD